MAEITSPVSGPHSAPQDRHEIHAGSPSAVRASLSILTVIAIVLAFVAYHQKAELADTMTQLNRANSDVARAKTDADDSKAQVVALQTQADSAEAQSVDLQKRLAAAQGQGTDLRSQLAKAQTAQADLRSQRDKAEAETAGLQSELGRANDSAAGVRKQLDLANAHADDLQSQLDKATKGAGNPQAAAAEVRALPIAATFEKAFWGSTYTMHVKNQGAAALPVNITVNGGTVNSAIVQAGATYDLGSLKAGSTVVVSSDGFETANLMVK